MKSLQVVNQLGAQYDKEAVLLTEALQVGGAIARPDLGVSDSPVCTFGADDGSKDATCYLVQNLQGAPGAAAYHDRDPNTNKPRLYLAYSQTANGEWLRDPSGDGDSYVGLGLHELFEAMMDELANLFAMGPWSYNGTDYTLRAYEACDPVQGITGTLKLADGTICDLPDYVLPNAYFGPAPKGAKVDALGGLTNAGDISPQGYQIAAGITDEQSVFAHVVQGKHGLTTRAMARKKVKGSRTMQRLEQIAAALRPKDPSAVKIAWV